MLILCLQQVFTIKPIENSPQCMTWVPYTKSVHEDAILFGDDQGYVLLKIYHLDNPYVINKPSAKINVNDNHLSHAYL